MIDMLQFGGVNGSADASLLHGEFSRHVASNHDKIAIRGIRRDLTYGMLDQLSSVLAADMIAHGIEKGDIVPIAIQRSEELAVALLATLKIGAAYAVANSSWSAAQFAEMSMALNARCGIGPISGLPNCMTVDLDHLAQTQRPWSSIFSVALTSDHPACVFFTSGTTGHAKGVLVSHQAITRLFTHSGPLPFDESTVIPVASNPSWDAFALEFWGPLVSGGTAAMIAAPFLSPEVLRRAVLDSGVNTAWMTSSLFNLTIDEDPQALKSLRTLMIGGEKLSFRHVEKCIKAFPKLVLINGYGPVENTVFTTTHRITVDDLNAGVIPIGRPVPGTDVFIRTQGKACKAGTVGEIHATGTGLALSYLGGTAKAAEAFGAVKLDDGRKLRFYRTGDLGWKDETGTLYFVGRKDRQVKLRGVRIDTEELEQDIESDPTVHRCRVVARREAGAVAEIIAFCVPAKGHPSLDIAALRARLPEVVLPQRIHVLREFPYTTNGKLDEAAMLAALIGGLAASKSPCTPGCNKRASNCTVHARVTAVFDFLLGPAKEDGAKSLFDRGGCSLDAARIAARLTREQGLETTASQVLRFPDPDSLAAYIAETRKRDSATDGPSQRVRLNAIQAGFLLRQIAHPSDTSGICSMAWRLPEPLGTDRVQNALHALQDRHPVLCARYDLDPEPHWTNMTKAEPELKNLGHVTDAVAEIEIALHRPLLPQKGMVWHAVLAEDDNGQVLGIAVHHIAFDGASEQYLAHDLSYLLSGRSVLPSVSRTTAPQPPQVQQFQAATEPLRWPVAKLKPAVAPAMTRVLNSGTMTAITQHAQRSGVARIVPFLSAWAETILLVTGQAELTIGVTISERTTEFGPGTIGCYLSVLPVRLRREPNGRITEKQAMQAFRDAQALAGTTLIPSADWQRNHSGRQFPYQTVLTLHDASVRDIILNGLPARFLRPRQKSAVCDVTVDIWVGQDGCSDIELAADPTQVGRATLCRISNRFQKTLAHIGRPQDATL